MFSYARLELVVIVGSFPSLYQPHFNNIDTKLNQILWLIKSQGGILSFRYQITIENSRYFWNEKFHSDKIKRDEYNIRAFSLLSYFKIFNVKETF